VKQSNSQLRAVVIEILEKRATQIPGLYDWQGSFPVTRADRLVTRSMEGGAVGPRRAAWLGSGVVHSIDQTTTIAMLSSKG
jgi:hypothetical protein